MKKFVFTLQALLNLKQSQEKQERNSLAALTVRLNQLLAEREDMLGRRQRASEAYGERLASGMRAAETQQYTSYFRMMKDLLAEQDRRIEAARAETEECRRRLVEVLREIHMLENLREKQYQQYQQEMQIEQEKTIGDFVSYQSSQTPPV